MEQNSIRVFADVECSAQSYCRHFPKVFSRAAGSMIYDEDDAPYLDFLACAGAVNFGDNHPKLKQAWSECIAADGRQAALDFHIQAGRDFVSKFHNLTLAPRQPGYRQQFTGPTGTSTVESVVKPRRKLKVLSEVKAKHGALIKAVRGRGLVYGVEFRRPESEVM